MAKQNRYVYVWDEPVAHMGILKSIFGASDESPDGPVEDQHEDENAAVGDTRIKVVPRGEVWGYDKDFARGEIVLRREKYKKSATYSTGAEHFSWRHERTLFQGTPDKWRQIKDSPEQLMDDVPWNWDQIVEHVDSFLEENGDTLDSPDYPDSTLQC